MKNIVPSGPWATVERFLERESEDFGAVVFLVLRNQTLSGPVFWAIKEGCLPHSPTQDGKRIKGDNIGESTLKPWSALQMKGSTITWVQFIGRHRHDSTYGDIRLWQSGLYVRHTRENKPQEGRDESAAWRGGGGVGGGAGRRFSNRSKFTSVSGCGLKMEIKHKLINCHWVDPFWNYQG